MRISLVFSVQFLFSTYETRLNVTFHCYFMLLYRFLSAILRIRLRLIRGMIC